MQYIDTLMNDLVTVPVITGLTGTISARLIFGPQQIYFSNIPVLDMLNGYDAMWLYFALFGSSELIYGVTGDFMLPLFNNQWLSYLARVSRPITIGTLSVGLLYVLDGFDLSLTGAFYAFLIGFLSDLVGRYGSEFFKSPINPLLQSQNLNSNSPPSFSGNSAPPKPLPYSPNGFNTYNSNGPITAIPPINSMGPFNSLFGLNGMM
jgi:hypothetical protein